MDYTLAHLPPGVSCPRSLIDSGHRRQADREPRLRPRRSSALDYDSKYAIRGLVVDCKLGNVFKMDRHMPTSGGCSTAAAGCSVKEERVKAVPATPGFNLSSGPLQVDRHAVRAPRGGHVPRPRRLRRPAVESKPDLPQAVSATSAPVDRRGPLETTPSSRSSRPTLPRFIDKDERSWPRPCTSCARRARSLFLLTNSYWSVHPIEVMSSSPRRPAQGLPVSWRNYFDVVIVGGSRSPAFFNERTAVSVTVDPETGEPDRRAGAVKRFSRDRCLSGRQHLRLRGDDRRPGRKRAVRG